MQRAARLAGGDRAARAGGDALAGLGGHAARARARRPRRARRRAVPGRIATARSPWVATSDGSASASSASASAASSAGSTTSTQTSAPRRNGSSRRASSAPCSSPLSMPASTSPARRRSVESATRRRSSSSATTVPPWCSARRSTSARPPESLTPATHACGARPRLGGDGQHERAAGEVGMVGRERLGVARARAAAGLGADRRDLLVVERAAERAAGQRRAAAVEHERRPADQPGERADDPVHAALGEHDALQALLGGDRAAQQRVLLVDQPRERLLGDRDERQLVRDLEQREAALARRLDQRLGHVVVREAHAEAQARRARGRPGARRTGAGPTASVSWRPVVSSSSPPDSHGVGSVSSEMCTHRIGRVEGVLAREDLDVAEVPQQLPDGEHR